MTAQNPLKAKKAVSEEFLRMLIIALIITVIAWFVFRRISHHVFS